MRQRSRAMNRALYNLHSDASLCFWHEYKPCHPLLTVAFAPAQAQSPLSAGCSQSSQAPHVRGRITFNPCDVDSATGVYSIAHADIEVSTRPELAHAMLVCSQHHLLQPLAKRTAVELYGTYFPSAASHVKPSEQSRHVPLRLGPSMTNVCDASRCFSLRAAIPVPSRGPRLLIQA